jgi:hypothetical protein
MPTVVVLPAPLGPGPEDLAGVDLEVEGTTAVTPVGKTFVRAAR